MDIGQLDVGYWTSDFDVGIKKIENKPNRVQSPTIQGLKNTPYFCRAATDLQRGNFYGKSRSAPTRYDYLTKKRPPENGHVVYRHHLILEDICTRVRDGFSDRVSGCFLADG